MDGSAQSLAVEEASQRLLGELVEAVPGDLGRIVRTIIRSAESSAYTQSTQSSDDTGLTRSSEQAMGGHGGPIPWATSILMLCCQAYNRPVEMAVPVGTCLELLGIMSSALDAVQDAHTSLIIEYAGGPSSHTSQRQDERTRLGLVSNAGIALIGLAWQALLEHGPRYDISPATIIEIGRLIANSWTTICHAQHLDLTLGRSYNLTLEVYDQIVAGKAGVIGGVATEVGALLVGAAEHRHLWRKLGTERTIAQQLWDDYFDLEEDLADGQQMSHPILYALQIADLEQRTALHALLDQARGNDTSGVLARNTLMGLLEQSQSATYTHACLIIHRDRAMEVLRELALPLDIHDQLEHWILRVMPL